MGRDPVAGRPRDRDALALSCPQGVAGGIDARVSDKDVAVDFPGRLGSPVNPGITTTDSLIFRGTYVGTVQRATSLPARTSAASRRAGGGPRTRTSFQQHALLKPGQPITFRVRTITVEPGTLARATLSCKPGERMLGEQPRASACTRTDVPTRAELAAVRVSACAAATQILVSATRRGLEGGVARRGADPGGVRLVRLDWPIGLLALLLVPLALAGYLWIERRRARYAIHYTNIEVLAGVVTRTLALARPRAGRARAARAHLRARGGLAPRGEDLGRQRAGLDRARRRHVGLDGGART